ncbi:MAG: chitobiase/beta-hexosaminidase C-terminal domain-containing protein [Oscillospiraceae bacterium]|nr:chitobiase/beta-hexosaminidase C-terminal domain-containing protein [Oscillospiraceae bacterium]
MRNFKKPAALITALVMCSVFSAAAFAETDIGITATEQVMTGVSEPVVNENTTEQVSEPVDVSVDTPADEPSDIPENEITGDVPADEPADVPADVPETDEPSDTPADEPSDIPVENVTDTDTPTDEPADTADADNTDTDVDDTDTAVEDVTDTDTDDTNDTADEDADDASDTEDEASEDSETEDTDDTDDDDLLEDEEEFGALRPVTVNSTTFPDAAFRNYVLDTFDKDGNYVLDADELLVARNIEANNRGIRSLKGIEYLTELRGLTCTHNYLTTMNLSKNKLLTGIWVSFNQFTSLDFTGLPDLEWIYVHYNQLTYLNVKNNPKMAYIEANTNPLGSIDVSHNPVLEHLMCGDCELTSLDVSKNPELQHLDCFRNKFTSLDFSHNPKMKRLDVWDNPNLKYVDVTCLPGLQTYNCANIGATKIDVSKNPELYKLICGYNRSLTTIDVSKNPKLAILKTEDCALKSLDISHNPNLHLLYAAINPFTTINIGNNPLLVKIYTEGESKPNWYGHIWEIDYGGDDSTGQDNLYMIWLNDNVKINTTQTVALPQKEIYYSDLDSGLPDSYYINREYVIQYLYEMAGKPAVSGKSRFKDVRSGSSYEKAVIWGEKNALCMGYPNFSDNTFGVGKWITRQDLVFMLMRYSEVMGLRREIDFGRADPYLDYYDIDYEHWEAVTWCATWHIMEGKGAPGSDKDEQIFDPYGRVTLSDFEISLNNLMEKNGRPANISLGASIPKPTVKVTSVFGGRLVNLYCADGFAEIYYNFGSSNITTSCKSIKPGSYVFVDSARTGADAALYFKAYRNGKWSELGKWGVLNVQIAKPLAVQSGPKSANQVKVYTQTKDSYIVYTLDGSTPSIYEGTNRPTVRNGTLVWSTSTVITVPKGKTVKAIAVRCGLATSDVMTYTNR